MILTLTTLTRRRYSSGSRGSDGRWSSATTTDAPIAGSLPQTISADELQQLPEGERKMDLRRFYTQADVRTTSQHDDVEADEVSWDGSVFYRVLQVEPYNLWSHNRVRVGRLREAG